ncbi:MAG TPA: Ig-like domain-containing protein [Streptosporangiaceae bacterium]
MAFNLSSSRLLASGLATSVLLLAGGVASAQVQVNLTAGPAVASLPDGSSVPMWGYSCVPVSANCAPLNPNAGSGWSPVVITVPSGQRLTINLTNNLTFPTATAGVSNTVPTSLVIVGQLGGGLGSQPARTPSPQHVAQGVTWPTANTGANFTPPPQPDRVRSFATEVAATGATPVPPQVASGSALPAWNSLQPGTYLIESGTHPSIQGPMGLYGILVVTTAPTATTGAGVAYPGVNYAAEIPLLLSEIDPVQNAAVDAAVRIAGFSETATMHAMENQLNAVLITSSGTGYKVSDTLTLAGGGCMVEPTASIGTVSATGAITSVNVTNPGSNCSSAPNIAIATTTGSGAVLTGSLAMDMFDSCGGGASSCYPPAVNYTPLYYLFNGVAFDKTRAAFSVFPATAGVDATGKPVTTGITGNILVRLVNAGLRMHVPSIVGSTAPCPPNTSCVPPGGFSLIAEDGNPLPGLPRVQSEVFMAAGKTYDVMVIGPATATTVPPAMPIYDRELSLSSNAVNRDAGMLAYIGVNGSTAPAASALAAAVARPDTYNSVVPGKTLTVSDPSKGVIANDTNVYGVKVATLPTQGTLTLNENGTFTYVASTTWAGTDSFTYCANGTVPPAPPGVCATVTLGAATVETAGNLSCAPPSFTANTATYLAVKTPGVLANCTDAAGYPLNVILSSVKPLSAGLTVVADANGGFTASLSPACTSSTGCPTQFSFQAQTSQGVQSAVTTATVTFQAGSGLQVSVLDGSDKVTAITDYRWVIEEDRTFYINPKCVQNPPPAGCTQTPAGIVPTLGVNFHTSYMPFVAQGCTGPVSCEGGQSALDPTTGLHSPVVCDVGNGVCRADPTSVGSTQVQPSQVHLDPTKRYYLSVLPGDAANPFIAGCGGAPGSTTSTGGTCLGHGMGGAPIGIDPNTGVQQSSVTVYSQPSPYQPAKLAVFVFEDDFPLNGEHDAGGGVDVLAPNEPGLGGFEIVLWDAMGGNGDFTGQMTHDMFNQPLSNALDGTIDPLTKQNACPISQQTLADPTQAGITGRIVTCPKYEADGKTLSPLAGQAVIANLMPGRFGVVASPAADRIARGEEWLQTNTLDGQKAHDSFARIGEPSYFQEFGPASYHVSIGFANPAIINSRLSSVCNGSNANITGTNCTNTLTGMVTGQRLSRTPDERLYSSGTHDAFYWTQCYVSVGDPDGIDFAFTKCNADGTFKLTGLPDGDWRITTFDQWNDQLVDGLSTPVRLNHTVNNGMVNMEIAATQWQTNLYTKTFVDDNKNGLAEAGETGIPFANVAVRLRDGSLENLLTTDFSGVANFNETFPLFSWYVVETDVTRYKNTGTHVVYDAGGPADGSAACGQPGYPPCGTSTIGKYLANTAEQVSVPTSLRVPGAIYCAGADCSGKDMSGLAGSKTSDPPSVCTTSSTGATTCTTTLSTGRIDPPWVGVEGWQGFPGQNSFVEFGKAPYYEGENGGIKGHVVYASTRPFDDPQMLVQTQWEPLVPHVTVNLYQEGFAADGVTPTLKLVDHTQTTSFDDWAQGFHLAADGVTKIPNMNCPGQGAATGAIPDLFFFSLYNQPQWLDLYANGVGGLTSLPYNSQFKCYDGMHNWNQVQPAPYDGQYQFPSVTSTDPTTGKPLATNCTICTPDPVPATGPDADPLRHGLPMLPPGKYVVEVVVPPGMELVKEEDKNILIGDNFIAPVTQQFGGLGNIFILPDQASVAGTYSSGAGYNANNTQNPTQNLGASPNNQIVPGFVPEPVWPCVGEARIVPDYISLFPQSTQVAPFAGATRRLCDRKEVTLGDQRSAIAKFYVFTSTHIASKFTGGITDDYTSEFDPFSPQFGEKFAPPDLPVSVKDWTGTEISRVYADHWGAYDGMTYSTWEVNPPNPTGYSPTMAVLCMNDPGPILDTAVGSPTNGKLITDPLFTQGYSQFCYELPFMPGTTQYLDTPVVPTSGFAGAGYNNVDCAEPDATPAISEVDGDGVGPYVSAPGHTLTITALGDQMVPNNAYSGPSATTAPFNQKTIKRHYGFGSTQGSVTIGGITAPVNGWSDSTITVTVPTGVASCEMQQQAQYGGPNGTTVLPAQCGELVITASNGKQSIDAVTVTIGGKAPTHVAASASIQAAIDAAAPGDLIIIDPAAPAASGKPASPAVHNELVLMWKPVRLQGAGASASIINANTHPAGKLTPWRTRVDCLFGLGPDGSPNTFNPTCGAGWSFFNPTANNPQVDRIAFEAIVGWDASANGNLAQLLQEPSLMGALEGAGITVLAKGVYFPTSPWDPTLSFGFPTGTVLFTSGNTATYCSGTYPSNFQCNPSRIDGLGITNSSQGGGGVFVHGWGHNLQIANNRVYNNAGTLSGGINVGLGEFPPNTLQNSASNVPPGSCEISTAPTGTQLAYCLNTYVNMHHNYVSLNNSTGDELFSATPAGAGGVSICTGSDYYKFNFNWVCGNLSNGDGGGLGHLGFSKNGHIEHNSILFNQSTNPTIPTNGGGIIVMGTPDADPVCGATTDQDCVSPLGALPPSEGAGPGLVINANTIMGNAAESGSGGGIAFQNVNGQDVVAFPNAPAQWYDVTVTNNIIANNVAGWDGGGVSLLDTLKASLVNNTIVSNVTTASAGVLTNTLGAPLASTQNCPPGGTNAQGLCTVQITSSTPQAAGLVSINNSAILLANLPATITCPNPNSDPSVSTTNGSCRAVSYPYLHNDVMYDNSSYYIAVGALSPQFQQNVVSLYNAFTNTLAGNQTTTGQCLNVANYWDIGVRGDTGPTTHSSGYTLNPQWSVLSPGSTGYNNNNLLLDPELYRKYCDGSRQPPEACTSAGCGWAVPPGISDATVPNPIFNLTPVATVDEGNNWINIRWGPLSLTNPAVAGSDGNYGGGPALGNYALQPTSAAVDYVPTNVVAYPGNVSTYLAQDFFGNPRPDPAHPSSFDVGAIEYQGTAVAPPAPTIASISPKSGMRGSTVVVTVTGTNLTETSGVSLGQGITCTLVAPFPTATSVTASCAISPTANLSVRFVSVITAPTSTTTTSTTVAFTVTGLGSITPNTGPLGSNVPVIIAGLGLTGSTAVNVPAASGITVSSFTVVSDKQINATFVIASTAAVQADGVTVTTPTGITNSVPFTTVPAVTGISPTSGERGTTVAVTVSGYGLTGATAVQISGATCTISSAATNTSVSASCAIGSGATLGLTNVTVTTPGGTGTGSNLFRVTGVTATFSGPSPSLSTSPASLTTKNGTITVTNVNGTNAASLTLTANPTISSTSTNGTFSITGGTCVTGAVVNPGGTCSINVRYAPTNTSSSTATVTITGVGLLNGTATSSSFSAN